MRCALLLVVVIPLLLTTGCDRRDASGSNRAAPRRVATTDPAAVGSIRGKVVFSGKAPEPRPIDNSACHPGAKPIFDESIVVNANGTLRNVVVYLKDVTGDAPPPTDVPLIDQVDCQYVPHVTAIRAGQRVQFGSSEPAGVTHNVHVAAAGINQSLTGPGRLPPVKFDTPDFVNVRCDVHPWMSCWLAVIDGPWFAVTRKDGGFAIAGVPAGTYTIAAWHERLPGLEQQVTVKAGEASDVTFTYKAE